MNTCIHLLIFFISLCLTGRNIQGQMKQFSIDKECKNKAMMGDYTLTFFTLIRTVHEPPGCSLFFLNQRLPTATWAVALLIKLIKKEPAWINWRGFFFSTATSMLKQTHITYPHFFSFLWCVIKEEDGLQRRVRRRTRQAGRLISWWVIKEKSCVQKCKKGSFDVSFNRWVRVNFAWRSVSMVTICLMLRSLIKVFTTKRLTCLIRRLKQPTTASSHHSTHLVVD